MLSLPIIRSGVVLAGLLGWSAVSLGAAEQAESDALLEALTADQPVTAETYTRAVPRARPRLRDGDVLSEQGRLRVHGGMSFTVGGGSGGSFHGASTWVSYHDPVTGISLAFAFSHLSGNGYLGDYAGYGYAPPYFSTPVSYYSAPPRAQQATPDRASPLSFLRSGRR